MPESVDQSNQHKDTGTAVRNVFDQYSQPENRLTHALATALAEDRRLCRRFIRWLSRQRPPKRLVVEEQALPGEAEFGEDEAERRGLPDIWIHDDDEWSLLIESKVASGLSRDQLMRHRRTAERRGFSRTTVVAIGVGKTRKTLPGWARYIEWADVYAWLSAQRDSSEWAGRVRDYMSVAERRMVEQGYLKEGTLTQFDGFPFDGPRSYDYSEAKRSLGLAMDELRTRKDLKTIGVDPKSTGRGAITGRRGDSVWDYLSLRIARGKRFTAYPHLTLSVQDDRLIVTVTVPHGVKTEFRRNLIKLRFSGFRKLMENVTGRLSRAVNGGDGMPWCGTLQRRYPSQRATPIIHAFLDFDLRTAFPKLRGRRHGVRPQPQWLEAAYYSLENKRSNLQLGVGANFLYRMSPKIRTRKALEYVARTWIACKPFVDTLIGKR